jgi:hypothetical protein
MDHKEALDREEMIEFVMSCWDEEAGLSKSAAWSESFGFSGIKQVHSGHILITTRIFCRP